MEKLYRIETDSFVAGVIVNEKGIIVYAAHILRWAIGKKIDNLLSWKKITKYQKL